MVGDSLIRMKITQFLDYFKVPSRKISKDHVKMEAGGGMTWTPTQLGHNDLRNRTAGRGDVLAIIDDFSTAWVSRLSLKEIHTSSRAKAKAAADAGRQLATNIRIYYGSHYIQIYKDVKVHEPRVSEISELVGSWFETGGYVHFRTRFVTAPMREKSVRGDGMHYQGVVDRMLSYMLLSAVCGEIESRVQRGTL
jgi:hypothetical protein